ncbi:Crp/Fnr family transcriptional regulator [Sneathiella aquimaris]|uniref:Crp/Fnr family transcriptional regulator n=1 Tax=Sneathiella aquimaris TaxID=2599305 RepID=UPI00146D90FD|nr:helix-turn-helix domain-containing protein [Sneathiella aquimaris]
MDIMAPENTIERKKVTGQAFDASVSDGCTKFKFTAGQGNQPKTDYCSNCAAHELALCSALQGEELIEFGNDSTHKTLKPGQMLFSEYDEANNFYTVVSGEIRLSRMLDDGRRQITGFKSIGDFVGLSAGKQYTVDAEAIDEVVVCQFNVGRLNRSMKEHVEIQSRLMQMMQAEVISLQDHMLLLGRKTPVEKIANFLYERAQKKFKRIGKIEETNSVVLKLPMSRTDIADFLGLTIETVSRTITKLRKQGVISLISSQEIEIHDLSELHLLADGEG